MEKTKRNARRMTEFGFVGVVVALLSFVQLWLYVDVLGLPAWWAYIIQTIVSVELNFFGNLLTTWSDRRKQGTFWKIHSLFWATRGVLIFINPFLFAGLAAVGVNYLVAQLIVLTTNTVVNWITGDKLVFKKAEKA